MDTRKLLGSRIKELRKKKGYTQDRLSEIVGIDSKHLSRIECGSNFPSLELLNNISNTLEIEPNILFSTSHLKDKKTLINEINLILEKENLETIRSFYKVLTSLVDWLKCFHKTSNIYVDTTFNLKIWAERPLN